MQKANRNAVRHDFLSLLPRVTSDPASAPHYASIPSKFADMLQLIKQNGDSTQLKKPLASVVVGAELQRSHALVYNITIFMMFLQGKASKSSIEVSWQIYICSEVSSSYPPLELTNCL